MNKRIGYALAAIAVVAAVVWLAMRPGERASPAAVPADAPAATIVFRTSTGTGEILPIDLSPGFEFLGQSIETFDGNDPRRESVRQHRQLQDEPRDPGWSDRVEAALRAGIEQELAAHGYDTQRIVMPVLECRSTGCEIQALAQDGDLQEPGLDFQLTLPKLLKGSLGNELELRSIFISSRPDRRAIWLAILARKEN